MDINEIKKRMKLLNMNQIRLAEKANIPLQTIRKIFSGNTPNPRIDTIEAIEKALEIEKAPTDDTAGAEAHEIMIQLKRAGLTEKLNKLNDKQMKALLAVLDSYTDNGNEKP